MNGQLLDELLAMARRDTDMRAHLLQAGKLYGEYADEMQQIHEENAKRLSEMVDRHGWPGVSVVGLEGCRAAWLIAQHSICTPALQPKFPAFMQRPSETAHVPRKMVAYVTLRVRFTEC